MSATSSPPRWTNGALKCLGKAQAQQPRLRQLLIENPHDNFRRRLKMASRDRLLPKGDRRYKSWVSHELDRPAGSLPRRALIGLTLVKI